MNYYEELGIGSEATEQEIRKAHRRLVKLMHPDAQPDQNLKMLAETQMRRLNSIVSTLLDSEQRRSYDEELLSSHSQNKQLLLPMWKGIPWWLASAVGAVVLTLVAVWIWADHVGNGFGGRTRAVYSPSERSTVSEAPSVRAKQEADADNQIGSASYKSPVPVQPPPSNDGVSTAVVPDVPPDTRTKAMVTAVEPKPEVKPPAVIAVNHAPEIVKQPLTPPPSLTLAKPEVKKVVAPLPKAPEPKEVAAQKASAKTLPPAVQPPVKPPAALSSVKQSGKPTLFTAPAVTAKSTLPDSARHASPPPVSPAPKKVFNLPAGTVIASTATPSRTSGLLPAPPAMTGTNSRDYGSSALPPSNLPAAIPPKLAVVTTAASAGGSLVNPRDPLEGEWVYAPKEPEKRKAGFYPPEFIDLKLFGAGDPGNLKGQYSAKYLVTDRPVSPEVTFDLASVAKGSRRFVWQSNNGTKGTLNIDPIDERTIRIDWHTTSSVGGPALTSGTATLVRRQ